MFVYNNCQHDSRVLKEAGTLAEAGYDVRIIALLDENTRPYEERDGFKIIRVIRKPLHYKILQEVRNFGLAKFLRRAVHVILKRPLIFAKRVLCLLFRPSAKSRHAKTRSRSTPSAFNRLFGRLKQTFREIHHGTTEKGAKEYCKCVIQDFPLYFFTVGWAFFFSYYAYRAIKNFFYHRLKAILMNFHRPLCFLDYYYRSFRLVRNEPADIYHAHDLNTLPVAYWAKRTMGAILVYDSHELYVERNRPKKPSRLNKILLKKMESFFVKSSDCVITVSESIGQELQRRYPVKRLSVILNVPSNCVKKSELSLRDELKISETDNIVLYVGNITINRGLEELIQSTVYLNHCVVVIMGGASKPAYSEELRQLAREIGVEDKVYYFGPVPQEDVISYASSANVGAVPIKNACLSYYYCLPNKLFECISAGHPTIGSNFPELRRIIEGYHIGRTFRPDDPKDIAKAINYVLSDKERYKGMCRQGLEAAKIFNWKNESKKLLAIYSAFEAKKEGK